MAECKCENIIGSVVRDEKMGTKPEELLCFACREALAVGRLVMKMKPGWSLYRDASGWVYDADPGGALGSCFGDTALEALKGGKK